MRKSFLLITLSFCAVAFGQGTIDVKLAERCFQEAKWASDDDGGKLWGKTLYGPIMFVDPETRDIAANQADAEGKLVPTAEGNVWVGKLPKEVNVGNTATQWAGVHWTMVMWGLPADPAIRTRLVMHECWHRIQDEIGLAGAKVSNGHLDTMDGRIWIKLEWRALSLALISWGAERTQAIADALIFRAYRRSLFPGAAAEEDRMEVHEGMAEYTGVRLMGLSDWGRRSYMAGRMKVNAQKPSYPFSFAYETGPSYGLLLDMKDKPWRPGLTPKSSLSDLCRSFEGISLPSNLASAAKERASAYNGRQVFDAEEQRDKARAEKVAQYRKLLIEGPILELPMPKANYTFDPNEVILLGKDGSVFPETQISDEWGVLEVKKGARVTTKYDAAFVAAPGSNLLEGDGWKLTLHPGWKVVPGARRGDFKVVREG